MASGSMYLIGILVICLMTSTAARTFEENVLITSTPVPEKTAVEPQQPNSTCFYAEPELCQQFNESEPCKECMPHPVYTNSLVCCNVTDLERSISCVENLNGDNKTVWMNIHVRNATLDELNISLNSWKLLDSLAITDGRVNRIVKEFPKFSQPKCLNMSNNNLHSIQNMRALKDLTRLQVLDLSYNNLTTIPNLNNLNLALDVRGNNGMLCKSVLESIERGNVTFIEADSTSCLMNQTFQWFNSTDLLPIRQLEKMKQLNNDCPSIPGKGNCSCIPERMTYDGENNLVFAAKVDCSNLGLTSLPELLPGKTFSLNVTNNSITSLSVMVENHSYNHLLRLFADDNEVESLLEIEGTEFIQNFDSLHLRRNKLKSIPYYLLDRNPEGRNIFLEGNRVYCDCNSAKVLKIWLLAKQNQIPDADKVYCDNMPKKVLDLSETKMCQSPHDWTDYIYYLIAAEVFLLLTIIAKVSYDYYVFKTAGYLPWPASQMPKLPCDWLCET
ncbi:protein halfway isoform X2 [Sitodiplosis mosellana]|uniref:protein halfway isoform X2 n=1 Tax=Sitodiplosis mosellana TaxID=263140 RepID=UPI00244468D7|nr:protein halfway isoform X2 [Sitodiplosis mosellana]